jgi:hypothetical protein
MPSSPWPNLIGGKCAFGDTVEVRLASNAYGQDYAGRDFKVTGRYRMPNETATLVMLLAPDQPALMVSTHDLTSDSQILVEGTACRFSKQMSQDMITEELAQIERIRRQARLSFLKSKTKR